MNISEHKLKEQICDIGRRLYNKGFAAANDGNITVRLNEREILCTPTMVSKGFLKPDDICKVDYDGKQLAGTKKRTSEVLLHLSVYKTRPDVQAVVHCHPPHATAFAVAREPIPKCVLPEIEVFLGEVAISPYETPGSQGFADTVLPYVKDTDTILLANHGTVTYGSDLEDAYFKTEIIDAYCRILILAKQLGRVNYYSDEKAAELIKLKPGLGIADPRLVRGLENCDLCGNSLFREGYSDFRPEPKAFIPAKFQKQAEEKAEHACSCPTAAAPSNGRAKPEPQTPAPAGDDNVELLVKMITDQVMSVLNGQNTSVVKGGQYASGISGGV